MSEVWEGCTSPNRTELKLDGNKVIVESGYAIDVELGFRYKKETTLHFDNDKQALEYYFKKK